VTASRPRPCWTLPTGTGARGLAMGVKQEEQHVGIYGRESYGSYGRCLNAALRLRLHALRSNHHSATPTFWSFIGHDYNNTHLPARSDPAATHYNVNVKSSCSRNNNNMSWIRRFGLICASAGRPRTVREGWRWRSCTGHYPVCRSC